MSTAAAIVVAALALACPLHMVWRVRQGRRGCCAPVGRGAAAARRERQRELGARIESLGPSVARREATPERH